MAPAKTKKSSKRKNSASPAVSGGGLLLEDGSFWPGTSFGATDAYDLGETVFHTASTGYQEILTDPSYRKQILVFSSVQMGNQGFHQEDAESSKIWASGMVARDYAGCPSHWRREKHLSDYLAEQKKVGIHGVDTLRLIHHLRREGNLWGVIASDFSDREVYEKLLRQKWNMEGLSLTQEVSTKKEYTWLEPSAPLIRGSFESSTLKRVVVMDFGVKRQILRYLIDSGFKEVVVVPAKTSAADIKALKPDALFLSNGPGDPAADLEIVGEVKKLLGQWPTFGICLGHQILGLALGLKTFKLCFGHHGANHPVMNLVTNRVEITSQNHGFAVDLDDLKKSGLEMTHLNLNDHTCEGFRSEKLGVQAIQFHPEAGPGPLDSIATFQDFARGFKVIKGSVDHLKRGAVA